MFYIFIFFKMYRLSLFMLFLISIFLFWCNKNDNNIKEKEISNISEQNKLSTTWNDSEINEPIPEPNICDGEEESDECKIQSIYITGFILSISDTEWKPFIEIEKIKFYTWDIAAEIFEKKEPENCAEIKKQDNSQKCYPLNDYYILKLNKKITYEIDPNIEIYLIDKSEWSDITPQKSTYKILKKEIIKNKGYIPYYFEIKNNKVVSLKEQFIP